MQISLHRCFVTVKVLPHQAMGEMTRISNVKIQTFGRRIFPVHTQHEANMQIKFAKRIKFSALSFAPKEKQRFFTRRKFAAGIEGSNDFKRFLWPCKFAPSA